MADTSARNWSATWCSEEFRVANAPSHLHFVADRRSGPILLKYAPERVKNDVLPRVCLGELCFSIGMSEPGWGSDLFAAKTEATKTDRGWHINGSKIWTTSAQVADEDAGAVSHFVADQREPPPRPDPVFG